MLYALDVLRSIIEANRLYGVTLTFVEHGVGINWRQRYSSLPARLEHVQEALVQPSAVREFAVCADVLLDKAFLPELYRSARATVISVTSALRLPGGRRRHLALMNLHPALPIDEDVLCTAVSTVADGMRGYLLRSGRFHHFYGMELLRETEWLRFNAQFLMPTVLVSERYVGHALFKGYSSLRLTVLRPHKPVRPRVAYEV